MSLPANKLLSELHSCKQKLEPKPKFVCAVFMHNLDRKGKCHPRCNSNLLASEVGKDWMEVTMTRLCGFLSAAWTRRAVRCSTPAQLALHIFSPLNRLKWQKPASPHRLCLLRYFSPSILRNICPHFQHFKVMSEAAFLSWYFAFTTSPLDAL